MRTFNLTAFSNDTSQELEFAAGELKKFNRSFTVPLESEAFGYIARSDNNDIIGAMHGNSEWEWVFIKHLWVREDYHGEGLGSELMKAIIRASNERGRFKYYLSTFDFQAPGFYKKIGFDIFGKLPGVSGSYDSYYMKREDTPPA